jgi:hypothetical protein
MSLSVMRLEAPVMLDFSGDRCARSVHGLSTLTRGQLEAFLRATARASAEVVVVAARRAKPERVRRTPRHMLAKRR